MQWIKRQGNRVLGNYFGFTEQFLFGLVSKLMKTVEAEETHMVVETKQECKVNIRQICAHVLLSV